MDDLVGLEHVKALALREIPKHGNTVLAAGSAQRAVRGDGDGVDVAGVASKVGSQSAGVGSPYLDHLVPASRDDDGGRGRGESHAGDPLGVAVLDDGELALTKGVPQLNGAVAGARDDLSVVGRKGNGENILGVADETACALASGNLPQAEGGVPRAGKGELAVNRHDDVGDEVVVATKSTTGVSVVALLAGEGPYNDGLV